MVHLPNHVFHILCFNVASYLLQTDLCKQILRTIKKWAEQRKLSGPRRVCGISWQIVIGRMQERNFILKLTHGRNLRIKLEMLKYCWWHLDVWRDVTSCADVKKHFPAPPKLLLLRSYLHLGSANRACRGNGGMENTWNMLIINHGNPKIRG